MNVRASAAEIIYEVVVNGRSLGDTLPTVAADFPDARDRALLQAICFGVCRWYYRLDAIALALLERPMRERDLDIHILLLVGLYQLIDMRIPDYAAVTETVSAVRHFHKMWAKALLNGVLRQYQREGEALFSEPTSHITLYSHPRWLIEKVQTIYPDEWETILDSNNEHPPFSLRVNLQQITRADYLAKLSEEGLIAEPILETPSGITLEEPMDVQKLPGFATGEVTVQDGAGQLAAGLLLLEPNQVVLDACAAPGGKTTHILETQPSVECIAVDSDGGRLKSVEENLQRLNLKATCIVGDATKVSQWAEGKLFDRILLDAPCSASGVIRRHPDIKLLRRESDIKKLVETQARLLNAAWSVLKPNGILLYATCSIFPEENTQVVQAFLESHADAKEEIITEEWGIACEVGKQILPGMHGMDGFYFARLRKAT